ncbi:MAG: molybdenum cofactor guanylyltransferase [Bdellovibrio sp.]|nr:molybdenum cofactor guanylyltransferase [Bdellovibrio sp.]
MDKVKALVLAGGKSSRMGRDKALLHYRGQRLIDVMIDLLESLVGDGSRVLVSGNVAGYLCVPDEHPEQGPLEGLRCALPEIENGEVLLVVPVDMPLLTKACLEELLRDTCQMKDFIRFSDSELPCIFAVSAKLREVLYGVSNLQKSQRSFRHLFLQLEGESRTCSNPKVLCNTNTPEEWEEVLNESKIGK